MTDKPAISLVCEDSNAFAILGRCREAMRAADYPFEKYEEFRKEATSGDYDHLLATVWKLFEVE